VRFDIEAEIVGKFLLFIGVYKTNRDKIIIETIKYNRWLNDFRRNLNEIDQFEWLLT